MKSQSSMSFTWLLNISFPPTIIIVEVLLIVLWIFFFNKFSLKLEKKIFIIMIYLIENGIYAYLPNGKIKFVNVQNPSTGGRG